LRVAVIGASGGMGSFFVRYMVERGAEVRTSDPSPPAPHAPRAGGGVVVRCKTNREAVKGCDVTILAVPMEATLSVAREVLSSIKKGSTVLEISSVKGETPEKLSHLLGTRGTLLSIHPLFGPALESPKGMKVAVIYRGKDERQASATAAKLFPDARIITMTQEEHDRAMATVLSLTHMINLAYAGTVARFLSPEEFASVSTPNSSMQLSLAEAVLAQDPGLSFSIQTADAFSREVARAAVEELERVISMVERSDRRAFDSYFSKLARRYNTKARASTAIREIYSAAEERD
jgi:prephenate dehydrogenase